MSRTTRTFAAAFDAVAMAVLAYLTTEGRLRSVGADVALWGSAAAAAVVAVLIATRSQPLLAWVAVGYVLFAALFTGPLHVVLVLLAVALMPIVQEPRTSFVRGLSVALLSAVVFRLAIAYVL